MERGGRAVWEPVRQRVRMRYVRLKLAPCAEMLLMGTHCRDVRRQRRAKLARQPEEEEEEQEQVQFAVQQNAN